MSLESEYCALQRDLSAHSSFLGLFVLFNLLSLFEALSLCSSLWMPWVFPFHIRFRTGCAVSMLWEEKKTPAPAAAATHSSSHQPYWFMLKHTYIQIVVSTCIYSVLYHSVWRVSFDTLLFPANKQKKTNLQQIRTRAWKKNSHRTAESGYFSTVNEWAENKMCMQISLLSHRNS